MPQMRLVMKWASRGSLPFMKMLYPRKIDDVLWHSATTLLAKSILVKMPRLPTMRVMGSQFISTRLRFFSSSSEMVSGNVAMAWSSLKWLLGGGAFWTVASCQFRTPVAPLRFLVDGRVGDAAKCPDHAPIASYERGGEHASRRLVHEWHELIGKAGHGAPDADAADVGTSADATHPAALSDIAVDDRAPATELDEAF